MAHKTWVILNPVVLLVKKEELLPTVMALLISTLDTQTNAACIAHTDIYNITLLSSALLVSFVCCFSLL